MKYVIWFVILFKLNSVMCNLTETEKTTTILECSIPICNENEEIRFEEGSYCGVCYPKESKTPAFH